MPTKYVNESITESHRPHSALAPKKCVTKCEVYIQSTVERCIKSSIQQFDNSPEDKESPSSTYSWKLKGVIFFLHHFFIWPLKFPTYVKSLCISRRLDWISVALIYNALVKGFKFQTRKKHFHRFTPTAYHHHLIIKYIWNLSLEISWIIYAWIRTRRLKLAFSFSFMCWSVCCVASNWRISVGSHKKTQNYAPPINKWRNCL